MTTRQEKMRTVLMEEISDILRREIKDPRLGFFTIIDAEITSDFRHAKVFVSFMGTDEEKAASFGVLKRAEHFVKIEFGNRVKMKTRPEIEFHLDETVDRGIRMFELLQDIKHDEEDKGT